MCECNLWVKIAPSIVNLKIIYGNCSVSGFMLDAKNTDMGNMRPFHRGAQDQMQVLNVQTNNK